MKKEEREREISDVMRFALHLCFHELCLQGGYNINVDDHGLYLSSYN